MKRRKKRYQLKQVSPYPGKIITIKDGDSVSVSSKSSLSSSSSSSSSSLSSSSDEEAKFNTPKKRKKRITNKVKPAQRRDKITGGIKKGGIYTIPVQKPPDDVLNFNDQERPYGDTSDNSIQLHVFLKEGGPVDEKEGKKNKKSNHSELANKDIGEVQSHVDGSTILRLATSPEFPDVSEEMLDVSKNPYPKRKRVKVAYKGPY